MSFCLGETSTTSNAARVTSRYAADPTTAYRVALCDLERPDTFASALDAAVNRLGAVDLVVVTAGLFAKQDVLENDLNLAGRLLATNFVNTVLFCEHVRQRVFAARGGVLVRVQLGCR